MPGDSFARLRGMRYTPRARLAFVADEPDSAQGRLARSLVPYLSSRFDVEVLYLADYDPVRASTPAAPSELFHELYCGAYDLVHAFTPVFRERVFEAAIAAEHGLADPEAVLERVLKLPLTASPDEGASLDPGRDRFAALFTDVFVPGQSGTSWIEFFERMLEAVRAETGPLSDLAVWERVKAWRALADQVRATVGPS